MSEPTSPSLCIGVLTFNEERRVSQCLQSALFADQVLVLDSGSLDGTCQIASQMGVEVVHYPDWQGFAVQRTRLLTHVKTDFVFFLDADEVITPALRKELQDVMDAGCYDVGRVGWCEVAFGRTLTHLRSAGGVSRFFRTSVLKGFEGVVHEHPILTRSDAPFYRFRNRLLHYSRESIYGCLQKLAQYVQLGAIKRAKAGKRGGIFRGFMSGFAIFLRLYVFRLGILCGPQGFLFCFFIALECFFRYVALRYDRNLIDATLVKR